MLSILNMRKASSLKELCTTSKAEQNVMMIITRKKNLKLNQMKDWLILCLNSTAKN